MTNLTPTQQLFAVLKPEDSSSQKAINQATQAAEQRWPLLKSLAPEKWAIAPALSDEEKLRRNRLEPIELITRKPAASAPNINVQLANALNRMVASKPLVVTEEAPTAPPTLTTSPPPAPVAKTATINTPAPATRPNKPNDNSILSVLKRIEQANAPEPIVEENVPGFLSRLGKR
jgi:hypothetical protein